MRKLLTVSVLFITCNSFAQDYLSIVLSKSYSNFNFTNSQGVKDNTIKAVLNNAYALNYQKAFDNNFFVRGELGYKQMGAYSVFNSQEISWNLNYADLNLGGGYALQISKVKAYLGASLYGAYLSSANQTIGADFYDIKKNNSIKKNDCGINAFIGASYSITNVTSIFVECAKSNGLYQLDQGSNQRLFNKAVFFKLGFTIQLNSHQARFKPNIL